ncbi:sugar phosphate isomerase/epimerase [Neorhizobium galegae]|uniref:sugar phosphate isomerase/epimerase family protein n=1 Tax=Neorhizobium galegae TaxID=399 RepID=UPI00126CF7EA|nr:sugar phosphate isomerase/epimerase [Neorhizobium galegae]KAA9383927.1 TIM barrel protein [Neorhizobium galegae]KAB1115129.1 TIM barrel protein [Neorhizobium galegae]MCM2496777.1 sugar phosphate isomerase/epimerase [Neorhizobium galegae]MCQ1774971.1 sugar phosphate isomerase/epimerase [Neorhizobium galegae]
MTDPRVASGGYRYALNPIQWFATNDGWLDPDKGPAPRDLLREIARSGFQAVHAQVPAGWTVTEYKGALEDAGLKPAPGYLSIALPEHGVEMPAMLEAARANAAQQAELGLTDMFVATRMTRDAPRVEHPGIGAQFDEARFAMILDLIDRASAVIKEEGVRAALHPHIGTWIETETETRRLLDSISADQLGFGPDTGHLSWAGADVIGLIGDYRDRIHVMHVKDCRLQVRDAAKAAGKTYQQTVVSGLWAEPGAGELDLAGMLASLGGDFDGWLIAEVDFPTLPPFECAKVSAEWLASLRRPLH